MRLVSMTDLPSPSGRPDMGGSGSPTPSTTRPEVVASGNPADAGSGLARGSDGSMVPPPALEGSGEASGRAGSRPLLPGGVLCEFTGYVPTLRPTGRYCHVQFGYRAPASPAKACACHFADLP